MHHSLKTSMSTLAMGKCHIQCKYLSTIESETQQTERKLISYTQNTHYDGWMLCTKYEKSEINEKETYGV